MLALGFWVPQTERLENHRHLLFHSPGGQASKTKVSTGPDFPWRPWRRTVSSLFHLLAAPGDHWLSLAVEVSLQSCPLSSHLLRVCVSLCSFLSCFVSYKGTVIGFRAHPNLVWSHLDPYPNYLISKYDHVLKFWVDMNLGRGNTIQPTTIGECRKNIVYGGRLGRGQRHA